MRLAQDYFNAHANPHRADGAKGGYMAAPAIMSKDEIAYSRALERAAMGKRKVVVSLVKAPWDK